MPRRGLSPARAAAAILGVMAVAAALLLAMERELICACGTVKLWHGQVVSSENSQHLTDWYTPSHVVHGLLFYAGAHLLLPPAGLGWRALAATVVEAGWEVVENTDAVIERYRAGTIALDYYGDSIVNSVADIGAMLLGFLLAARLPVAASVAVGLALEIYVGWAIRDNLVLNVLMLLWPVEAVKAWQAGAG
jgi:hypothetical protein